MGNKRLFLLLSHTLQFLLFVLKVCLSFPLFLQSESLFLIHRRILFLKFLPFKVLHPLSIRHGSKHQISPPLPPLLISFLVPQLAFLSTHKFQLLPKFLLSLPLWCLKLLLQQSLLLPPYCHYAILCQLFNIFHCWR